MIPRALLCLAFLLPACSSSYTCGDFPEAVCQSVSETYDQSNDPAQNRDSRQGAPSRSRAPASASEAPASALPSSVIDQPPLDGPFLTRPRLLRILVTPWEDKHHDLHSGGFIYLKLEDSQWMIPK